MEGKTQSTAEAVIGLGVVAVRRYKNSRQGTPSVKLYPSKALSCETSNSFQRRQPKIRMLLTGFPEGKGEKKKKSPMRPLQLWLKGMRLCIELHKAFRNHPQTAWFPGHKSSKIEGIMESDGKVPENFYSQAMCGRWGQSP